MSGNNSTRSHGENLIKIAIVVLTAVSCEVTMFDSLQSSLSAHDMKHKQNDMKMSSLGAKRQSRLTEKHTDLEQDFNRFYDRSKHTVSIKVACLPRTDTHVDSYLFYCVQQLKKHKVQVFSMFLMDTFNGPRIKKCFRLCTITDICVC